MAEDRRVIQRVLSPARAATRQRLIDSAIALATTGGYESAGLRQVAEHAGLSVPTVYQHFASKDEILLEALMALGEVSNESIEHNPPSGDSPATRLLSVFSRILHEAASKPLLYRALYRGYIASAPGAPDGDALYGLGPEKAAWVGATLRTGPSGGHSEEEFEVASQVLSCLFLGAMVGLAAGRSVDDLLWILGEASHRLLPTT